VLEHVIDMDGLLASLDWVPGLAGSGVVSICGMFPFPRQFRPAPGGERKPIPLSYHSVRPIRFDALAQTIPV
jgi:hypothetical protein